MDNWNERKNQKIKEKKELIEKNDPNNKECIFKPYINNNAKIKKEDEGLLYSDRLYLEYFTLREKKKKRFIYILKVILIIIHKLRN